MDGRTKLAVAFTTLVAASAAAWTIRDPYPRFRLRQLLGLVAAEASGGLRARSVATGGSQPAELPAMSCYTESLGTKLAIPCVVEVRTTAELRAALSEAKPGTRIEVAAGEYEGFSVANVAGTAEARVIVICADSSARPRFTGGVQMSELAYVELAGLVIERAGGNGLNIDDGGSFETPSHHVYLRDLDVRDCGGRGNDDGIKLSGVVDFRVERCTVERWGRGGSAIDMVGCRDGEIVSCTFRDREAELAATGVQMKGGSQRISVVDSRFEHAGQRAVNVGGSTGLEYFRPKPAGFEAKDISVEGCTFVGSLAPIAFVGVDGASVRFNTFHRPRKWLARILQETRGEGFAPCRGGNFSDNLVVYRASEMLVAVNVGPDTAPETFEFARNFLYCEDEPARARPSFPVAEREPAGGGDPLLRDAAKGDLRLKDASPASKFGADAWPRRRY